MSTQAAGVFAERGCPSVVDVSYGCKPACRHQTKKAEACAIIHVQAIVRERIKPPMPPAPSAKNPDAPQRPVDGRDWATFAKLE